MLETISVKCSRSDANVYLLHARLPRRNRLTKFDAFRVNRDQVMDLETRFKFHTNISNVETASPKTL